MLLLFFYITVVGRTVRHTKMSYMKSYIHSTWFQLTAPVVVVFSLSSSYLSGQYLPLAWTGHAPELNHMHETMIMARGAKGNLNIYNNNNNETIYIALFTSKVFIVFTFGINCKTNINQWIKVIITINISIKLRIGLVKLVYSSNTPHNMMLPPSHAWDGLLWIKSLSLFPSYMALIIMAIHLLANIFVWSDQRTVLQNASYHLNFRLAFLCWS